MPVVRVGVVGCGNIARGIHIPVLQGMSGVKLLAIAEIDAANRAAAAKLAPHASVFSDFAELIASNSVDAVVICLPPQLHAPCAIAAFAAGLHVYVEKPLAPSVADGELILRAWQNATAQSSTVGMIGFNFRFHSQVQDVRESLRHHGIGDVIAVRTTFTILPHDIPQWKRDRTCGGGVLLDLASHHFDLIQYTLGDRIAEVFASRMAGTDGADHVAIQLTMQSGIMAQVLVSLGSVEEHRLEYFGSKGKFEIDRTELLEARLSRATLSGARATRIRHALAALNPTLLLRSPGFEPSFQLALAAFVRSVSSRVAMEPNIADGLECLAVIEAAERSIASRASETPLSTHVRSAQT